MIFRKMKITMIIFKMKDKIKYSMEDFQMRKNIISRKLENE